MQSIGGAADEILHVACSSKWFYRSLNGSDGTWLACSSWWWLADVKMEQKKKSSTSSCKLSRGDQEGKGEKPGDCHNCAVSMSAVIAVATVVIEGELIKREKSKTLHRGIQEKKNTDR